MTDVEKEILLQLKHGFKPIETIRKLLMKKTGRRKKVEEEYEDEDTSSYLEIEDIEVDLDVGIC